MLRTFLIILSFITVVVIAAQWDRLVLTARMIDQYGISAPIGFVASKWLWKSELLPGSIGRQ